MQRNNWEGLKVMVQMVKHPEQLAIFHMRKIIFIWLTWSKGTFLQEWLQGLGYD